MSVQPDDMEIIPADPDNNQDDPLDTFCDTGVIILGGGLAGLSTGYILSQKGVKVCLFEAGSVVGGLSRTITQKDFHFDVGGHRFLTTNKEIEKLVLDLLEGEYLTVSRTSKIFMFNRYFDYPLKPANAIFGLGLGTTLHILFDYCK